MNDLDVSVIVVNWNTQEVTCNCLRSIYEQPSRLACEVVVIDNASSDRSVEAIRQEFPQVRLIENKENRGFAAANNQGMALARGRYVLLLNSDTIVLDSALDKVIDFADEHADAAVVGCRVLNPDKTLQRTCFMFPSLLNMFLAASYLYRLFPRNKFFGRERMTWWDRDDVREVDVVTGCFMLVRKGAIDQVGYMDDRFFMYGEETDWCYRFKRAGWKVLFAPVAEIIHLGGQSSDQVKGPMCLQLRGSILSFLRKHKGLWSYVPSCVLVSLFFFLRIPVWFVRAVFSGGGRDDWKTLQTYVAGAWRALCGWEALSIRRTVKDEQGH